MIGEYGIYIALQLLESEMKGGIKIGDRAQDFLVLVPEPTTLLLLGAGLLGLGFLVRRKIRSLN